MSNTRYHESHYVTVLDNPPSSNPFLTGSFNLSHFALAIENSTANHIEPLSDHNPHDWPPVTKDTAPEVAFPGMPNKLMCHVLLQFKGSGALFSEIPKTLRARKAIRRTPSCIFCKAGLFMCFRGSKK